jgi:hypothetical protein
LFLRFTFNSLAIAQPSNPAASFLAESGYTAGAGTLEGAGQGEFYQQQLQIEIYYTIDISFKPLCEKISWSKRAFNLKAQLKRPLNIQHCEGRAIPKGDSFRIVRDYGQGLSTLCQSRLLYS